MFAGILVVHHGFCTTGAQRSEPSGERESSRASERSAVLLLAFILKCASLHNYGSLSLPSFPFILECASLHNYGFPFPSFLSFTFLAVVLLAFIIERASLHNYGFPFPSFLPFPFLSFLCVLACPRLAPGS